MQIGKIVKDALALFIITLVSALFMGFVYEVTAAPIAEQKEIAKQKAYQQVFPEAAEFQENKDLAEAVASSTALLEAQGYTGITIDEAVEAIDSQGTIGGHVITITTKNGYGNAMTLTCGRSLDGTVIGIEFLSISETAGLGMKAKEPAFKEQFKDKQVDQFIVTKIGKKSDNEIDSISGATITSSAVTEAVNAGGYFITSFGNRE